MNNQANIKVLILALILATAVGLIAISGTSFWIDEGGTGLTAMQPSIATWWGSMLWERNSNMQLPLYLVALWAWGRAFGLGEWALRMFNLPCYLLAVFAVWLAFRDDRRVFMFSFLFLSTSAYVWFYLDQARPYAFLLAGSMFLFGAAYNFWRKRSKSREWAWWFALSCLVVCATSIIGFEWAVLTIIAVWYIGGPRLPLRLAREFPVAFGVLSLGMTAIGLYYVWSLKIGADVPKYGRSGLLTSLASMTYEYLGFAGLGPNRNALRTGQLTSLAQYALPLGIYAALLIGLLFYGRPRVVATGTRSVGFYSLLILPAPIVMLAGYVRDVRVLPRHLTPLMPIVVLLMGVVLATCWKRGKVGRSLALAFLAVSMVSAWQIRFATRHVRDNYRYAALAARREIAKGNRVLWVADAQTAMYYGLLREEDWDRGGSETILLFARSTPRLPNSHSVVLYSKPDLYDKDGQIRLFILKNNYSLAERFEAFELWRSPSPR